MRIVLLSVIIIAALSAVTAQTHEQTAEKFARIQQRIEAIKSESGEIERNLLRAEQADLLAAEKEGVKVFRILPREKYDKGVLKIRGGGSYYSFSNQSHSYNDVPQISLEQNYLKVGFYGASYGFLKDLGEMRLDGISDQTKEVGFSLNYEPPVELAKAGVEQRRAGGFTEDNNFYSNRLPVKTGHSYLIRAISYGEADVLAAIKVEREDVDGSLIIFWKLIKEFEVPKLEKNQSVEVGKTALEAIRVKLTERGFYNVIVDDSTAPITLRGVIPKGKMAEVIQLAQEEGSGKPIKNELVER